MNITSDGTVELTEYELKERQETIAGLRELLECLENGYAVVPNYASFLIPATSREELLAIRAAYHLPSKDTSTGNFAFEREFRGGVKLRTYAPRETVCQRVKVGTKVMPATPEVTLPAKPERVEEIYDWICPDSILSGDSAPPWPSTVAAAGE